MKNIAGVRANEYYHKVEEKFERYLEMILLLTKPRYKFTNRDDIVNEIEIEEARFVVNEKNLKGLILSLIAFLDDELAEELKSKLTEHK